MTKTMATVGIVGRNWLSLTMHNTEERAHGKWITVTQYPKAERIISGTLFRRVLHVTEVKVIVEDWRKKNFYEVCPHYGNMVVKRSRGEKDLNLFWVLIPAGQP